MHFQRTVAQVAEVMFAKKILNMREVKHASFVKFPALNGRVLDAKDIRMGLVRPILLMKIGAGQQLPLC